MGETHSDYQQWLDTLSKQFILNPTKDIPKDLKYWEHIYLFASDIVRDLENRKNYKVARDLHMSSVQLSNLKPLILAIATQTNPSSSVAKHK